MKVPSEVIEALSWSGDRKFWLEDELKDLERKRVEIIKKIQEYRIQKKEYKKAFEFNEKILGFIKEHKSA